MIDLHEKAMAEEIQKIAWQPWPRALPEELWKYALNPTKKREAYIKELIEVQKHIPGIISLSFTRLFMEGGVGALYMRREVNGNKRYYEIKAYRRGRGLPSFEARCSSPGTATKAKASKVVDQ